jgi:hypothetical protein
LRTDREGRDHPPASGLAAKLSPIAARSRCRQRLSRARRSPSAIQLNASDLVGHLNCRNLTELDLAVAKGALAKPSTWNPLLDVLRERGLRHELGYVDHLNEKGLDIETVAGIGLDEDAVAATSKAMRLGREVIVQGAFLANNWGGRPMCS